MIEIATGMIGSGKSYYSVIRILKALLQGRKVVTNTSIKLKEMCMYVARHKRFMLERFGNPNFVRDKSIEVRNRIKILTDDEMFHFWDFCFNGSFIVLDELHLYFHARDWNKIPKDLVRYLSQSRKGADDLFLMTQTMEQMSIDFRRLASKFWHVHNMKNMPFTRFIPIPMPEFFVANCYYSQDNRRVIETETFRPNKTMFSLYDTLKTYTREHMKEDVNENDGVEHTGHVLHEHYDSFRYGSGLS